MTKILSSQPLCDVLSDVLSRDGFIVYDQDTFRHGGSPIKRFRAAAYGILGITIISAILTPTPDAFNLAMMALPLYLLFEIGLIGMRLGKPDKGKA